MKTYTIQELLEMLAKWEPLNLHEAQVKRYAAIFLNQTAEQEPE